MVESDEYKQKTAQHIYTYYNTDGKHSIAYNEKVKVSAEKAVKWLAAQNGKETLLILKKMLDLSNGQDSCDIKLQGDGELRMLFMTGDGINYKSGKESDEQQQATQRAQWRCEDLKRRGYLGETRNGLYIALSGKEYYYQNSAKLLRACKATANLSEQ